MGSAYRLNRKDRPSPMPAEIAFHYGDAGPCRHRVPEALAIAYQDDQHFWRCVELGEPGQARRRITVSTSHLSDWSLLSGFQLRPATASVSVEEDSRASPWCTASRSTGDELVDARGPLRARDGAGLCGRLGLGGEWSRRGQRHGGHRRCDRADFGATFTAPGAGPTPDLVAVSARARRQLWRAEADASSRTLKIVEEWKGTAVQRTCDRHADHRYHEVTWTLESSGPINGSPATSRPGREHRRSSPDARSAPRS